MQIHPKTDITQLNWVKDFNYDESQIHDISIGLFNPCPSIPVKIDDKEVKLLFDTGNGEGLFLTTTLNDKIDYEIIGKTTELNSDGSYRGEGNSIILKKLNVFNDEYTNVKSTLTDWKMYGFFRNNGGIGLKYFKDKVITLDYDNKKIAVGTRHLDYSNLQDDRYTIIPLICSNLSNEKNLVFFQGEINGEKSTIYLDTGSTRSFLDFNGIKDNEIEVKLGDKVYKFNCRNLKCEKIGFQERFKYPLKLALNSDLLKSSHFIITFDLINNNLIISQN